MRAPKNKDCTRAFSDAHEKSVCKALNAVQQINSGATKYRKGDVVQKESSTLIECKCCMKEKDSVSIKKEWIEKNKEEAFSQRFDNSCIAFNFEPNGANYYVIDERLMRFLIEKIIEEN